MNVWIYLGAVLKKRSEEVEELLSCLDNVTSQVARDTTNLSEALESSASQSESRIEAFIQKCIENRVRTRCIRGQLTN